MGVIGTVLALAFGGWAAIVKRSAESMARGMESAAQSIDDLKKDINIQLNSLREEIHKDRLMNERRLTRLENHAGFREQ